MIVIKLL